MKGKINMKDEDYELRIEDPPIAEIHNIRESAPEL